MSEVITTAAKQQSLGQRPCIVFQRSHGLFLCDGFKSKDGRARFNIAKQHGLCFNRMVPGHYAHKCRKPSVCSVPGCSRKHTKFLHTDVLTDAMVSETNQPGTGGVTNGSVQSSTVSGNVYLPIVPVKVNHESHVTYALLDSGSISAFISQRLASRLSLDGDTVGYRMNTLDRSPNVKSKVVSISVAPCHVKTPRFHLINFWWFLTFPLEDKSPSTLPVTITCQLCLSNIFP